MKTLPLKILKFVQWWTVGAPKKLHTIVRRLARLVNNQFAFTLNLRLMFTPVFGDYTFVGRCIGFVFRSMEVVVGLFFVGILFIFSYIVPVLWWTAPLLLPDLWLMLPIAALAFVARDIIKRDTPEKRIAELKIKTTVS